VDVACERIEDFRAPEKFDVIITRAFADLGEFISGSCHLLAPGGTFIAMKGVHPHEEIAHLPPGYAVKNIVKLDVPGLGAQRHVVLSGAVTPAS
jgi:16S rRNA (guanine527-N7)-methyltransferase